MLVCGNPYKYPLCSRISTTNCLFPDKVPVLSTVFTVEANGKGYAITWSAKDLWSWAIHAPAIAEGEILYTSIKKVAINDDEITGGGLCEQ